MTKDKKEIPALSPEMKFYIDHYDEVDDFLKNSRPGSDYFRLLERIRTRFEQDFKDLFKDIKDAINDGGNRLFKIKWGRIDLENEWQWQGPIHFEKREKIGSVGFALDSKATLVGWAYPKGGMECREKLAVDCAKKVDDVHFTGYHNQWYGDWEKNNHSVIWLRAELAKISRIKLINRVKERTNKFFKVAKDKWP